VHAQTAVADPKFDENLLRRDWVHVSEEDTADRMVFRPADALLAPSRGRFGLRLEPDARVWVSAVGRGDEPETIRGSWHLVGKGDQLELTLDSGETRRLEITELDAHRLVVKK
jgi:hypothetical protein